MPAKKPKPNERPQCERFVQTAREIGADETNEGFEKAFDLIVMNQTSVDTASKNLPANAESKRLANTRVSKK